MAAAWAGVALAPLLPINKNLWTGTYVLLSSGLAALLLAFTLALEEKRAVPEGGFLMTFGRNPLLAFVASGLLAKTLLLVKLSDAGGKKVSLWSKLFHAGFSWVPNRTLASHLFALAFVAAVWAIVRPFERRGIYWKV
jgi:predicted acyltransferase